MRSKKCKACKEKFTPDRSFQTTCSFDCAIEYAKKKSKENRLKANRKAKRELRDNDKSIWIKTAQRTVNRYVNLRDKNEPCISCGCAVGYRQEAGHFRSSGGNSRVRFNTLNIHSQCHKCNCYLSGNLVPYRDNLIVKIGLENVEWLESQTSPKKYEIDYLKRLAEIFRKKIERLEK